MYESAGCLSGCATCSNIIHYVAASPLVQLCSWRCCTDCAAGPCVATPTHGHFCRHFVRSCMCESAGCLTCCGTCTNITIVVASPLVQPRSWRYFADCAAAEGVNTQALVARAGDLASGAPATPGAAPERLRPGGCVTCLLRGRPQQPRRPHHLQHRCVLFNTHSAGACLLANTPSRSTRSRVAVRTRLC